MKPLLLASLATAVLSSASVRDSINGRVASEVLGIHVAGHQDLETLLIGFNAAYDRPRHSVFAGLLPVDTVHQRLELNGRLANPSYKPADHSELPTKIDQIIYYANEVSQPDI